jgi:hypothetical protein
MKKNYLNEANNWLMSESDEISETIIKETSNEDVIKMFIDDSFPKNKMPVWMKQKLNILLLQIKNLEHH